MYYHKAAGSLAPDSQQGDAGVAQAAAATTPPGIAIPDVSPRVETIPPAPTRTAVTEQPIPAAPMIRVSPAVVATTPVAVPSIGTRTPTAAVPTQALAQPVEPGLSAQQVMMQTGPQTPLPLPVTQNPPRLPPRSKIFLLYDDKTLEEAIKAVVREEIERGNKGARGQPMLPFPELPKLVPDGTAYLAKTGNYPQVTAYYEPGYVAHRRLHFEERNAERNGWDLGIIQPFVSTAYFYKDALLWPQSLATSLFTGMWDTNAGKCLPGTPTPYYLYPPGLTVAGLTWEATVFTGLTFLIP